MTFFIKLWLISVKERYKIFYFFEAYLLGSVKLCEQLLDTGPNDVIIFVKKTSNFLFGY